MAIFPDLVFCAWSYTVLSSSAEHVAKVGEMGKDHQPPGQDGLLQYHLTATRDIGSGRGDNRDVQQRSVVGVMRLVIVVILEIERASAGEGWEKGSTTN
jgi:hypothetical protein